MSLLKVFGKLEALRLIIGAKAAAIKRIRQFSHALVNKTSNSLAIFENEGHIMRAHFEHRARTRATGFCSTKARIKEARIMDAEFADERIKGRHLGGMVWRHAYGFF